MLPPLTALTLFAVWGMVLVASIGAWRLVLVLTAGKRAGDFTAGAKHGSDAYWRLNRAHMNTVENLPIFGVLVLSGAYLQVQDLAFQLLPSLVLYARIAQSTIHLASGSAVAVTLRFTAYLVQVASMFVIAYSVLAATGVPLP
ncbi:MAG: MAPEG family protein [Micropepsaceae bacterium]